jgi:hypothetical protein
VSLNWPLKINKDVFFWCFVFWTATHRLPTALCAQGESGSRNRNHNRGYTCTSEFRAYANAPISTRSNPALHRPLKVCQNVHWSGPLGPVGDRTAAQERKSSSGSLFGKCCGQKNCSGNALVRRAVCACVLVQCRMPTARPSPSRWSTRQVKSASMYIVVVAV